MIFFTAEMQDLDEFVDKIMTNITYYYKNGIPEYDIGTLDPYDYPEESEAPIFWFPFNQNNNTAIFEIELSNFDVTGFSYIVYNDTREYEIGDYWSLARFNSLIKSPIIFTAAYNLVLYSCEHSGACENIFEASGDF